MKKTINKIAAILLLLAGGCAGPAPSHEVRNTSAEPGKANSAQQDAGKWTTIQDADRRYSISFRPRPATIEPGISFALDVRVVQVSDGEPIDENTRLTVDAAMPEHRHGMNVQPQITRVARGTYEVKGMLMHMPGHWELYFDLADGPVTTRATIPMELE